MNPILQHRETLLAQCPAPVVRPPNAADLPIHATTWGETGASVLIVHGGVQGGLGGGPSSFARQQALAKRGWRLRVVDRPGFGESPTRGPDDMEADAIWIAGMLDAGTLKGGAHLIGHSWGGAGSLLAAARRPDAVRSLILIEPALQPLLMTAPDGEAFAAAKADAARTMGALLATRSPGEYGLVFARSLGRSEDGGPNAAAAALEADPERATDLGCALLHGRMASPELMRQAAETVVEAGVPVLIITGGWSLAFDGVGAIAAKLMRGRHQIVRAPDHFPQTSNADAFNDIVDNFMREADIKAD